MESVAGPLGPLLTKVGRVVAGNERGGPPRVEFDPTGRLGFSVVRGGSRSRGWDGPSPSFERCRGSGVAGNDRAGARGRVKLTCRRGKVRRDAPVRERARVGLAGPRGSVDERRCRGSAALRAAGRPLTAVS